MLIITSDKDLPKLLGTPTKQVKWAKKLISEHLGDTANHVHNPPMQRMFSKTLFVTLVDDNETVIQFRTERLDTDAFVTAKGALGTYVRDVRALHDEELENAGAWAFSFTLMPGKMWHQGMDGKGDTGLIAINTSLGRVFSKGYLADSSSEAVSDKISPHLDAIFASPLEEIAP